MSVLNKSYIETSPDIYMINNQMRICPELLIIRKIPIKTVTVFSLFTEIAIFLKKDNKRGFLIAKGKGLIKLCSY